ncbi:MAG: TrpR-related protein YerC/YecD [Clostridiales bacterium]|nr:TrpR-related protein YerC/YecD [Clostridiales bacterium]
MTDDIQIIEGLYEAILKLNSKEECKNFFDDLCTYKEVEQMAQRVEVAKMLLDGATYDEVIAKTNISSATLSRVSKCIKRGKGYNTILKKQ